jgi:chemotaxis protein CheC
MKVSEELQDLLTEIFHIGVGRAASSIAQLLDYKIELKIPNLYFLNQELLEEYFRRSKEKSVCVIQYIYGEMQGVGVLSFPLIEGKTLVDNILYMKPDKSQFGAVEIEAIQEIGNIVINAIGGAFGNIIGLKLSFKPPTVHFLDYPMPPEIASNSDNYFYTIASTKLKVREIDVEGIIMLTFAYSNIEIIEQFIQSKNQLSKKFGEILLEKQFITQNQLDEAVKLQVSSKKFIGELMVEKDIITVEQRNSILTNQRYKDCKKRFGELILEDNLIGPDQLDELLKIQKYAKNFIGEILVAMGVIDEQTKEQTLVIQKVRKNLC